MNSPREQFPTLAQAAFLLLANFLLQSLLLALFHDLRPLTGLTEAQSQVLVMVLAYGIVLVSTMHFKRMNYRDLVHASPSSVPATLVFLVPPLLLLLPLILLLDQLLLAALEWLLPVSRWEELSFSSMVADDLPAVLATCVLAPVLEEMLFRGVLLRSFLNQHPRWAAISYSALFFGAAHLNVYQFVLALWLGLVLGWLFERSRSLLPCMTLHAAINTTVYASAQGEGFLTEAGTGTWLAALAAAALGSFVLRKLLFGAARGRGEMN